MNSLGRTTLLMIVLAGACGSGGCRVPDMFRWPTTNRSPIIFNQPPTADDIVRAVNSNTAPIRQLDSDSATVTAAGFPPLRANLALERPRKLRLRAQLIGPEVDIGSNDELFWMWIKHNPQPGLYFARHDQYAVSPTRRMLPIDPSWLTEALGVVQLDPLAPYEGPFASGPNRLELRTRVPSPDGELTRVYVVHDKYGWVLEQRVFDPRGQLLASAVASQHQHYPEANVSLPQHVEVRVPSAEMALSFNVRNYRINALGVSPELLWSMPQMEGYPLVDIANPPLGPPGAPPTPVGQPSLNLTPTTSVPDYPSRTPAAMSAAPRYRGYTERR